MKYKLLLCGFLAAMITSCQTYRAGQTPDDVYFSPAKEAKEMTYTQNKRQDRYEEYLSHEDDQYLRMKTRNRDRWSAIDDYDYWNDSRYVPYYTYNYYRNNWNNSYVWNNWNPGYFGGYYGSGYGYYSPNNIGSYRYGYGGGYSRGYIGAKPTYITKRPPISVSRPALSGYSNRSYNNGNTLGNTILKAFSSPNTDNSYSNSNRTSSNNNTYSSPERTYTPSSSSSSNSSAGSSSGGGVSRPARTGGN